MERKSAFRSVYSYSKEERATFTEEDRKTFNLYLDAELEARISPKMRVRMERGEIEELSDFEEIIQNNIVSLDI